MDYPRYDPNSDVMPLTAAELDGLDRLLQALPTDDAMTIDGLDGYLTALRVGPADLLAQPGGAWMPPIWGGDSAGGHEAAAPFASKRQRKGTVLLVLRHLRHISEQLARSPDQWEPVFGIAESPDREWVDARDWCAGFLQAVDLQPEAWGPLWRDPVLGPLLAPLLQLGGGLDGEGAAIDDPETCDALSRRVPDAVLQLHARQRR